MLLTITTLALAGCESIPDLPDAMNPMSWFSDDEKTTVAAQPDSTKPYPKLNSVPERPKIPSLAEQQAGIAQGLTADTKNARYTDAQIRKEVQKRTGSPASRTQARVAKPVPATPIPAPPPMATPTPRTPPVLAPVMAPMQAKAAPVAPPAPQYQSRVPAPQASSDLVQIATIYFADGSTVVQRVDTSILRQIADAQKQSGGMLAIVGHASGRAKTFDAARRSAINYEVSLRRAKSVGAALVGLGVPPSRLQMDGAGDSKQVYSEFTAAGEAANRRVEIFLRR
ncbi:MAG: OmpA family protein [Rhodospirillaceae bacterium]|nr:OmpA family protein [Rhodospirillaceae bacterium]MBT5810248.1 OmpA family protein [Rhodospirillaceae bacterium]